MKEQVWRERIKVEADSLRDKVEDLIHEGYVRRIVVKNAEGYTVMELPLSFGVLGAVAAPMLTAVGAIAGAAAHWTLEVERRADAESSKTTAPEEPAKTTL